MEMLRDLSILFNFIGLGLMVYSICNSEWLNFNDRRFIFFNKGVDCVLIGIVIGILERFCHGGLC